MFFAQHQQPYTIHRTQERSSSPPQQARQKQTSLYYLPQEHKRSRQDKRHQVARVNHPTSTSNTSGSQEKPRRNEINNYERQYQSSVLLDNKNKENVVYMQKQPKLQMYDPNYVQNPLKPQKNQYPKNYSNPNYQVDEDYKIQKLKNKVEQMKSEISKMVSDNHYLQQEVQKGQYQRTTLQQNYAQLVQMYEQSQREVYSEKMKCQKIILDNQYNEQYKNKLHQHIEEQKDIIVKLKAERLDQNQVRLQTQVLDLQQENHSLRQELGEVHEKLFHFNEQLKTYSYDSTKVNREKQILKDEQEKLLKLSEELLNEATALRSSQIQPLKGAMNTQDSQYELLIKWRNFMLKKYTYEFERAKLDLKKDMEQGSPRNSNSKSLIITSQSKLAQNQEISNTKSVYQKINRMTMQAAGLQSFKLNYILDDNQFKAPQDP